MKDEPEVDPKGILQHLAHNFVQVERFTSQSRPTHMSAPPHSDSSKAQQHKHISTTAHRWVEGTKIASSVVLKLFNLVKPILAAEPTLLELEPPLYVIGDLHGNYYDLLSFADTFGLLKTAPLVPAKFLFLGDFVDRGLHSLETLLWLFSMKVLYPDKVFMLRGNHEFTGVNTNIDCYQHESFLWQLQKQYTPAEGVALAKAANEVFALLPLAAVVDSRIFCVHGGLPRDLAVDPNLDVLAAIRATPRPISTPWPPTTLCFDLVWSDPATPEQERTLGTKGLPPVSTPRFSK